MSLWRTIRGGLQFREGFQDGIETLEEGTADRAAVYPRRVMEAVFRRSAAAMLGVRKLEWMTMGDERMWPVPEGLRPAVLSRERISPRG